MRACRLAQAPKLINANPINMTGTHARLCYTTLDAETIRPLIVSRNSL